MYEVAGAAVWAIRHRGGCSRLRQGEGEGSITGTDLAEFYSKMVYPLLRKFCANEEDGVRLLISTPKTSQNRTICVFAQRLRLL
jgi:hypothetical protein